MLCNFIEIARRHGCSSLNLLHIFRTPFPKNTCGGLLLIINVKQGSKYVNDAEYNFLFYVFQRSCFSIFFIQH